MAKHIVNCAHHGGPGGFLERFLGDEFKWTHVSATAPIENAILSRIRKPDMKRILGCRKAAQIAKRESVDLVVTHDPRVTFPTEHFLRWNGYRGPHLAYSFNYPWLPAGFKRWAHNKAFETVTRFVVYSTLERQVYHQSFGIPLEKLDFVHWGVNPPPPDDTKPIINGDYVCALGENSRDYATLIAAMRRLPHIKLVMVVRPHNLVGLDIPANVQVLTNIPLKDATNVLRHCRFMALPLNGPDVPCGHVTLVNAMHLGKAFAITRSSGVVDYVRDGENAIMCTHGSVDEMTGAIERLWQDTDLRLQMGEQGRLFASEYCSENRIISNFHRLLVDLGVVSKKADVAHV